MCSALVFHRYEDRYFLYRVSEGSHGWQLKKSPVEKQLIAKNASARQVNVVAAGHAARAAFSTATGHLPK
jgi:hypothetical protein